MNFTCKYCKETNPASKWNESTSKECGNLLREIESGYSNMNYFYICPNCGAKMYKKDWKGVQ